MLKQKTKSGKKPPSRTIGRPRGQGTQKVYDAVREEILRLRRRPGDMLDESSMERQFAVSRTPVREALIRLASEGLVELMPNRGARVAYLDVSDIPQLFEALELFQRVTYRWCALRQTSAIVKSLREENSRFEAAARRMDIEEMGRANHRFHMVISEGCGNIFVGKTYETLLNDSLRLATTLFANAVSNDQSADYFMQIVKEHADTIDLIARADAEGAERIAVDHTQLFRRQVLNYMERSRAGETKIPDPMLAAS